MPYWDGHKWFDNERQADAYYKYGPNWEQQSGRQASAQNQQFDVTGVMWNSTNVITEEIRKLENLIREYGAKVDQFLQHARETGKRGEE